MGTASEIFVKNKIVTRGTTLIRQASPEDDKREASTKEEKRYRDTRTYIKCWMIVELEKQGGKMCAGGCLSGATA